MREDQAEWQNAVKSQNIKREKQERKAAKGTLDGWDDPDVSRLFPLDRLDIPLELRC